MRSDPVLVLLNGLGAVVSVVLAALVLVGVIAWDPAQVAGVVAAVVSVCALVSLVVRASVFSPETTERLVGEAEARLPSLPMPVTREMLEGDRVVGLAADPTKTVFRRAGEVTATVFAVPLVGPVHVREPAVEGSRRVNRVGRPRELVMFMRDGESEMSLATLDDRGRLTL